MILLSIEINCMRGIKNLKLNFTGKTAVIYGDNGTGKSGVIDAIDFLIKGDITRLSGVGSKSLTLVKHGKYVTEEISNAWVKANVKLPNHTEEIEIKRYLNNPGVLVCDSKYKADFEEISRLSALQAHYLSRREILQFINSTDQERAKNIEKLLNLYLLEKNRSALQKAKKAIEDELKTSQAQEKTYISKISEKLGCSQDSWLSGINDIRFQLGATPITELNDGRKNFCKLLKEQFPQKQFIITTHDYIWRKELESQGVVIKKNIIHFKTWNIEHGPYVEIGSNIWDAINSHLDKGEKNEAIGLMRYYMEEFFSDICAKYKLKVPYSTSGRWSLEEVLSPVNAYYRQAIKSAKDSAISFKKSIDRIEFYEKSYTNAYNKLQVERWTINPSTHFTAWAQSLSIDELKQTCAAVKEFCAIFECPNCKSFITINFDINLIPQNICCDCGDYSFSCIKKK